jgi:hypothetical protein
MKARTMMAVCWGAFLLCHGSWPQADAQTVESAGGTCVDASCEALSPELDARLRAFLDALTEALSTGDAERLGGFFVEESSVFYPGAPFPVRRVDGREAIEAAWRSGLAAVPTAARSGTTPGSTGVDATGPAAAARIVPQNLEAQSFGDIVLVTFELGPTDGPGRARRTIVWLQRGGDWFVLHLHASALGL